MMARWSEIDNARFQARRLAQQLHCNSVTDFMRLGKNALVEINVLRAVRGTWKFTDSDNGHNRNH